MPVAVGVAISRDGVLAYVVNNSGDATVSRLRTYPTTSVAATFPVGASPHRRGSHPTPPFAYVANTGEGTVSLVDLPSAPQNPACGHRRFTGPTCPSDLPASDGGSPISTYMYLGSMTA